MMKKKQFVNFVFILIALGFAIFPKTGLAASVNFTADSKSVYLGDVFIVEARISSPDEPINVADGAILFDRSILEVKELSTGASIFGLWAQPPVFSNETGRISFVGGSLDGFRGDGGSVLKIVFFAKKEGSAAIDLQDDFSVFLGNGKGTKIIPQKTPMTVSVLARPPEIAPTDEWRAFVLKDKTAPQFVEALIDNDPSIFDDRYFAAFFATDDGSGIAYYEIQEGDRDFMKAQSPYLIQDQALHGTITVKAVDRAGNESLKVLKRVPAEEIPRKINWFWLLALIVGLIIVGWLIWLGGGRFRK